MKKLMPLALITLLATTLSSCELVEGIFKAGVWTGVILVVVVIAIIIWLIAKVFGGRKD
jgi:cytosine/uracil/thiamine/allantoin permease